MSFSVMRRMAGLVLALVWSGARLAQPLQPSCPHHAAVEASAAAPVAPSAHVHHGLPTTAAPTSTAQAEQLSSEQQRGPESSCECAAHCCAASSVAISVAPPTVSVPTVAAEAQPVVVRATRAPTERAQYRQPPATAPPALLAV